MRKSFAVSAYSVRKLVSNPRVWAVLIMTWLFIANIADPVKALALDYGLKVSPAGLFAFMLADPEVSLLMGIGILLMLFDAPFTDEMQLILMTRSGKCRWAMGQVIYITETVLLYLLISLLILTIALSGCIETGNTWGGGLDSMIEDGMYEVYDSMLDYDYWVYRVFTPFHACASGMLLHFLGYVFLGLLLFDINLLSGGRYGFFFASIPLIFDTWIVEYLPEEWYRFSPASLMRITALDYGDEMGRPSRLYAAIALAILSVMFVALAAALSKRSEPGKVVMK